MDHAKVQESLYLRTSRTISSIFKSETNVDRNFNAATKKLFLVDAALNAHLFPGFLTTFCLLDEGLLQAPPAGFVNLCFSGLSSEFH